MRLGEPVAAEREADSGNRLTHWLCGACGTALYCQNASRPRVHTIYVGSLDDPYRVEVAAHIWTKRRHSWVTFPDGHRVFGEAGDWRVDYASDPTRLDRV